MEILFSISIFLTIYAYVIFPVIIHVLAKLIQNTWKKEDHFPTVTIIISAYNEEQCIEEKVINSLRLLYPKDKMKVIVCSDGSTDKTVEIVSGIKDARLFLKAFNDRKGKTECLNQVVPFIEEGIVLFTDANSMFPPDMLQHLVKNFSDSAVGAVTGWTKYQSFGSGEETTGLYARLEKKIKLDESYISSCVGADGAIFAIRKELYLPLEINDINDFVIPLNVVCQDRRVVLDPLVFCIEEETAGLKNVYSRQVRITTRTAWAIRRNISLLNIFKFGSFSFLLFSHKVMRFLTPLFFLCCFALNLSIVNISKIYTLTLTGQLLFLAIALAAMAGILKGRFASVCKYFLITFAAQLVGCFRMILGIEDVMWTPKR